MATRKVRKTEDTDLRASYLYAALEEVERKLKMSDVSSLNQERSDTGLLCLDLILGGGLVPGMYTFFGKEQSAKSTLGLTLLSHVLNSGVPLISFFDYEGSASDPTYLENILMSMGVKSKPEEIFGIKDSDGSWVVQPKIRYHDEAVGETFYRWLAMLERRLPDKRFIDGKWWLVYEDNKENKAKIGELVDQKATASFEGGLFVPAEDGKLQAIILVDSYPAMNPEKVDEDDANSGGLAVKARMFSEQIPRIKARLKPKRIALVGINQLRDVPMAMYGPKEAEPGGQALKFYSDVRLRLDGLSLSSVPFTPKGEGQFEKETSINGKADTYRYIRVKAIKNKFSQPYRETWLRLWVEDDEGEARGFDRVFDTIYYLQQTGQVTGNRKKLTFNLDGIPTERPLTWEQFKKWQLSKDKEYHVKVAKYLGLEKPISLRALGRKQLASGRANELYTTNKQSKEKVESED